MIIGMLAQSENYVYDRRPWPVELEEEKIENTNNLQRAYTDLLVVYPNPTGAKLTVEIRAKDLEGDLIIRDLLGRPLLQKIVSKDERVHFINLEHLVSGLYIVQFIGGNGNSDVVKVVKQ